MLCLAGGCFAVPLNALVQLSLKQTLKRYSTSGKNPMLVVGAPVHRADGTEQQLTVKSRIDTAIEVEYVRHGGILPFVLRQLLDA